MTRLSFGLRCSLGLVLVAFAAVGCSSAIVGSYDGGAAPENADFHIARATFKDDQTFTAYAKRKSDEGQVMNGSFEFDGFHLKLKQAGKPQRVYSATYNSFAKSLDISDGAGHKQTLKKM